MEAFAIILEDERGKHVLIMFGYDGGNWRVEFSDGGLFRPVYCSDLHSAYTLINMITTLRPCLRGCLRVVMEEELFPLNKEDIF